MDIRIYGDSHSQKSVKGLSLTSSVPGFHHRDLMPLLVESATVLPMESHNPVERVYSQSYFILWDLKKKKSCIYLEVNWKEGTEGLRVEQDNE